jgi:hypothetical protein
MAFMAQRKTIFLDTPKLRKILQLLNVVHVCRCFPAVVTDRMPPQKPDSKLAPNAVVATCRRFAAELVGRLTVL